MERMYIYEEGIELLKKAQEGDVFAEEDLLESIRTKIMPRRIGKFLNKNRQVEDEDLKQEFMIGVALGVGQAKLDVGDPIEFIIQRGIYRVRSYMRKFITQGTRQICLDCGTKSRLNKDKLTGIYTCKKCGSTHINTDELNDHNEITLISIPSNRFEDELISKLLIDEFKSTLTEGTNLYNLYEMLESGIDRDNPLVKNYIKEIATEWGTSSQNVVQNLNKLKSRLEKFMQSKMLEVIV